MSIEHLAKTILLNHIKKLHYKVVPCGRSRKLSFDYIIDRIFHLLTTGCQWTKLEVHNGSWKTIYYYFSLWSDNNLFEMAYSDVLKVYLKVKGFSEELIVDTSFIKNVFGRDCTGASPFDRGRKATKVSAVTDKSGVPLAFTFHKGNRNDSRTLFHTLNNCKNKAGKLDNKKLYADKIYDTQNCKEVARSFNLVNEISRKRNKKVIK